VRRAAGKENRRSGTARSAPGASGTLHPSNCPGGEHGLRLQAVIGGRRRSLCREPRGRKSEGYARRCYASPAHPSSCPCGRNPWRRARLAASDRHWWTDAEPLPCVAQPGRESQRWSRSERAGRGWYVKRCAASVQLPGRRARLAASGRPQWTDAKTFREPRSRKSEGYARRCFTSPAHPSSCPCGRNPWRRARLAASGRHWWTEAEPLPCVARPGKKIVAVEPPGTRRARVVREVVRCIRPIARAASTACGFRPSLVDGRGALSCVAQPGKRIVAVEPPGARRARVVRCIRPIARAASMVCASGRHWWTDAELYRASRSRERESQRWNRPERAGRG